MPPHSHPLAATQPSNYIRKLHQERRVVVCSNRVARKRPARGFFGFDFLNRHTAIQLQQQRIQVVHTGGANLRDTFFVFVGCSSCDVPPFSQSVLLQGGLPRPAKKKKRVCQDACEKAFEQHRQEHRHTKYRTCAIAEDRRTEDGNTALEAQLPRIIIGAST